MATVFNKIRIVARSEAGRQVTGKDVSVFLVRPDGEEICLPGVQAVTWGVSGRHGVARAGLVLRDVELEVEGEVDSEECRAAKVARSVEGARKLLDAVEEF